MTKFPRLFLLTVASTLPFMLFVVAPLSFFFGNINEIAFDLDEVALPVAGLLIASSIFLFLVLLLLGRWPKASGIVSGVLVGLAAAIWVQSQLLVIKLGQFNGRQIDWSKWTGRMVIGGIVWIIVIGLIIFLFHKGNKRNLKMVITAVFSLGILSVLSSFMIAPKSTQKHAGGEDYKDLFNFHPENNVLVLILDAFQSDYFNSIIKNQPQEVSELDGFTFYRNTVSRYPSTMGSLPSIMTGAIYRNQMPFPEFIASSREKFGLVRAFKNKSYTTHFAGLEGTYPLAMSMQRIVDKYSSDRVSPVYEYLDYGAFRALPTFLKRAVYNNGNWFLSAVVRKNYPPGDHGTDLRFLELLEQRVSVNPVSKGSFKILHFCFPHPPLNVDENLRYEPRLAGENGYARQARGAIKLASEILKLLKDKGIYDNTEIVIMSDHGTWEYLPAEQVVTDSVALSEIPTKVQSSSHALLLYKPAISKGNLIVNDLPLETTDLSCILGLENNNNDCSGFIQAKSGENRRRTFYFYEWVDEDYQREYLPDMNEYVIEGHAYARASYQQGGSFPTPRHKKEMEARSLYTVLKEISFSAEGNKKAEDYLIFGWSYPEDGHRWSDGQMAVMSVDLGKPPENDLMLRLWGDGYYDPRKNEFQRVKVVINGQKVALWNMTHEGVYEAPFKATSAPDGKLHIVFKMSNHANAQLPENAKDPREFGLMVKRMVIQERK
ncbi:MAG: sulfatase-like hydrolase/transferase [Bacteroidales bacterium]